MSVQTFDSLKEAYQVPEPRHIWWDDDRIVVFTGADIPVEPAPERVVTDG